ncbi:hypothetical protein [Legionella waltersii]|uniref:ABC transporter permease n=1 Tax=Legionella waltersii TaxID=66969 RepID=A0A0W1A178_9GAMM|nr:hypothetical protein [Legionella waltersii]KTD75099.1 ABC transporter permease [Legionella waltersii]SNV05121.1 ABC transporter permease [Legionella waltersii]
MEIESNLIVDESLKQREETIKTILTKQEEAWVLSNKFTRATDEEEVLIYPMGAERYLLSQLLSKEEGRYPIIDDIKGKNVLVIPGYGNSAFLFADAGATSVTVYDKDPVTIAWVKAFKKFYHFRECSTYPSIGEVLTALSKWYPPLLTIPGSRLMNTILWGLNPKALRKRYLRYMLSLTQKAMQLNPKNDFELEYQIDFHSGELKHCLKNNTQSNFDTVYVPYLLGVTNGIERVYDITQFIHQIIEHMPSCRILITPSQKNKEFHIVGSSYFSTTEYNQFADIPGVDSLVVAEDSGWFKTQGMLVLGKKSGQ